ncbi:MAG TPA: hypothetical protein VFT40_11115 [Sphingomicrobium sp.]|nr:hypothetical protein [Sphingomicrobium sp.]
MHSVRPNNAFLVGGTINARRTTGLSVNAIHLLSALLAHRAFALDIFGALSALGLGVRSLAGSLNMFGLGARIAPGVLILAKSCCRHECTRQQQ